MGLQGQGVDSACIQSLNGGQLLLMLLHEVCQPGQGMEEGREMGSGLAQPGLLFQGCSSRSQEPCPAHSDALTSASSSVRWNSNIYFAG